MLTHYPFAHGDAHGSFGTSLPHGSVPFGAGGASRTPNEPNSIMVATNDGSFLGSYPCVSPFPLTKQEDYGWTPVPVFRRKEGGVDVVYHTPMWTRYPTPHEENFYSQEIHC